MKSNYIFFQSKTFFKITALIYINYKTNWFLVCVTMINKFKKRHNA